MQKIDFYTITIPDTINIKIGYWQMDKYYEIWSELVTTEYKTNIHIVFYNIGLNTFGIIRRVQFIDKSDLGKFIHDTETKRGLKIRDLKYGGDSSLLGFDILIDNARFTEFIESLVFPPYTSHLVIFGHPPIPRQTVTNVLNLNFPSHLVSLTIDSSIKFNLCHLPHSLRVLEISNQYANYKLDELQNLPSSLESITIRDHVEVKKYDSVQKMVDEWEV